MNLPNPVYGETGIDTQLTKELHHRLPHLDYDILYGLVLALHVECFQ